MRFPLLLAALLLGGPLWAQELALESKPADPYFEQFDPVKAPPPGPLLLQKGDRLAICGDSITEQKMYSRLIEDYLTVCVPQLEVTTRQYGWSGERASGFLKRMENDCLRFLPTVATICYGMNDHLYRPFTEEIGESFRTNLTGVVEKFQEAGTRLVLGSSGTVGKMPTWVKEASGTVDDLNVSLGKLRNIGLEIAAEKNTAYADIYWPMITQGFAAKARFGDDYFISGKDGVHPGWAGHLVMAYAFLRAMGLDGKIGAVTLDFEEGKAEVSDGHVLDVVERAETNGSSSATLTITSHRYPLCATGPLESDGSIRSGMELVPFNQELNRFVLKLEGKLTAAKYKVTWGTQSRTYLAGELSKGVNLAADFLENPFTDAFKKVDAAVLAKQAFETKEIKQDFRSPEAKEDLEAVVIRDEERRDTFTAAIKEAFVPVTYTIVVEKL